MGPRLALRSAINANSFGTSGLTVGNLPVVCAEGAATFRSVLIRETLLPHQHAVTAN
jgi:hypothetical protein